MLISQHTLSVLEKMSWLATTMATHPATLMAQNKASHTGARRWTPIATLPRMVDGFTERRWERGKHAPKPYSEPYLLGSAAVTAAEPEG